MSGWRRQPNDCAVLLIDIQEKLIPVISDKDRILNRVTLLARAACELEIPMYFSEQVPEKLGPTISELQSFAEKGSHLSKSDFSAVSVLDQVPQPQHWIVCGIETHICVRQTAFDLLDQSASVTVIADAVSSRNRIDDELALSEMRQHHIACIATETLLFEWLKSADAPDFKVISGLVKAADLQA